MYQESLSPNIQEESQPSSNYVDDERSLVYERLQSLSRVRIDGDRALSLRSWRKRLWEGSARAGLADGEAWVRWLRSTRRQTEHLERQY